MDDLNATISSILNDPQKIEQLRNVAQSLGIDTGGPPPQMSQPSAQTPPNPSAPQPQSGAAPGFDPATVAALFQGLSGMAGGTQGASGSQQSSAPATGMPDPSAFAKLAGLFGSFNQSDKNVELLRSLRPHFSPTRAGKIDDAVRIMQIIRMWPALRDSGLLSSLGNLGGLGNLFGGGGGQR